MDVIQAIKGRRSIRKFKPLDVDRATLIKLLDAIRWAPSWGNRQCWRIILVRDEETRKKLAECLKSPLAGKLNFSFLAVTAAPVVVVACAQRRLSGYYQVGDQAGSPATDKGDWFLFDVGIAMQNLALAAYSLGLGTVHIGLFDAERVGQILGVPPDIAVVELMPLGYPDETPDPPPRKELHEFVFENTYGQSFKSEDSLYGH